MTIRPVSSHFPAPAADSKPWRFSPKGIALRLFATCWVIYMLHSATNIAREHYLMLAIGDHLSFRVDEYQGLHPDLFEKPGYGWHINSNPGVSLLAAIPYAMVRPVIQPIVARVQRSRAAAGQTPPLYDSPWPNARAFYARAWPRGLDVKFGLAAAATQAGFMAPLSSLIAVGMFLVLRRVFGSDRTAIWLTLLYAFGTPVFFRTGYLNHNLVAGYAGAAAFALLWNPHGVTNISDAARTVLAGGGAALAVVMDYSGIVLLAGLFAYGLVRVLDARSGIPSFVVRFSLGASGPLAFLLFYQWVSFGDPIQPAQRWMSTVAYIDRGYQGLSWPMPDLLLATLFDYRYGLVPSCPLIVLAFLAPWLDKDRLLPRRETWFVVALFVGFWLFCGSVNYGRLQFNTGVRYMTTMLPFLFLLVAVVLVRLPLPLIYTAAVASVTLSWCLAMHRDVERGLGVLDPVLSVFIGGFELPALTTLSRLSGGNELLSRGVSPLPLFAVTAAVLYGLWAMPVRRPLSF